MPDYKIHSKLPCTRTSIFTVMSALAAQCGAINLSQGFPDYPMSEVLIALTNEAMRRGHNQYAPMAGLPALREAIAEKIQKIYNTRVHPDTEITITPGGTYAIYAAVTTIIRPGDEVILFEPAYDSYIPNIEANGGIAVPIPLEYPGYEINWERVKEKISPRTRMIMINSPHNPSGSVLQAEDMQQLRDLVKDTGIFILSDEVYEHLVYDGASHQTMLRYPELLERSFVCFSFGKVYHNTGWKMGYCVAPAALTEEYRKIHQFLCFSCFSPAQYALAEYLKKEDTYLSLPAFFQQKRDYFLTLLKDTPFTPLSCAGSYFQLASYRDFSRENDKDFAIRLTKESGVAAIPVSAFYQSGKDDRVLRFCFAKKQETLERAAERLRKL